MDYSRQTEHSGPEYPSNSSRPREDDSQTVYSMPGVQSSSGVTLHDPFADHDQGYTKSQAMTSPYNASANTGNIADGLHSNVNSQDNLVNPYSAYDDPNRNSYNSTSLYPHESASNLGTAPYVDKSSDSEEERRTRAPGGDTPKNSGSSAFGRQNYSDLEYSDPYASPATTKTTKNSSFITLLFGGGGTSKYPLEQKIEAKRRGSLIRQTRPYVVWALTATMAAVYIYESVVNWQAQGSPFSFKPYVNPLLGPSQSALIRVGARFPPCMKHVEEVPPTMSMGCLNNTALPPTSICTIEDLCGFGGFKGGEPNQSFRFITAIFLHAGLVHILVNMFVQLTLSSQVEKEMGSIGFIILYFAAGTFGNVLGGNFSLVGVPSVGASGAIFGTVAVMWVDLIAHWQFEHKPLKKLAMLTVELAIGIAIGFIPGVDNFAHIGGFTLGLLSAIALYPIISATKLHTNIVWFSRLVAAVLGVILFVVLIRNFYTGNPYQACTWCRYLSCIPTAQNDHCQGTGLASYETTTTGTT